MKYKLISKNKTISKLFIYLDKNNVTIQWLLAIIFCLSFNAVAQTSKDEDKKNRIEQITVTARLVKESKNDIPFTVNIIDGKKLIDDRETTLEKALNDSVGVQVISNMGASKFIRIRGVGSVLPLSKDDSSVSINVDGLPQSVSNATSNLLDIESVEVLKGPQGTLFGRNSEAGAINIISKRPTSYFETGFRTEYGQDKQTLTEGMISGPFNDVLSGRLAFRYDEANSILKNRNDNKTVNTPRNKIAKGSLLWQMSDITSILFRTELEEITGIDDMYMMRPYSHHPKIDIPKNSDKTEKKNYRFNLKIEHEFKNSMLTYLSGYSHTKLDSNYPIYEGNLFDHLSHVRPPSHWAFLTNENILNQEIRISSKPESSIFWLAGINYYNNHRQRDTHDVIDVYYPTSGMNAYIKRKFKTNNVGIFGEITYPITEKLKLTTGIRQSHEQKDYDAKWYANKIYIANAPQKPKFAKDKQKITDNYTTGRLALSYQLYKNNNLYGIYSRGYKTGGFNDEGLDFATRNHSDPAYKASYVNAYEIGLKLANDDNSLGLNTALFYNNTKREHLTAYNPATFVSIVENYHTRSYGAELEGYWQAPLNLEFRGTLSYTNAKIVGTPSVSLAKVDKNNYVPETSKWNASISIQHYFLLNNSGWSIESRISDRYVGSRQADVQNSFGLKAYNKLDARIAIKNENIEFYVWGDNLLNKRYDLWAYYMPGSHGGPDATIGSPSRGRTLGIGFSYIY